MKTILPILLINVIALANLLYWTTSDRQQECIRKIEQGRDLTLYEKCSVYSIHCAIMTFGSLVSPEAARQEFYLSYPHGEKVWKNNFNIKKQGRIGLPYTIGNLRTACALNGCYLVGDSIQGVMEYPYLKEDTRILGFRFNEGLLNYLQTEGWLFPYKFKYYGQN